MDDDTIEEHLDEALETVPDNAALEVGDDTVVTSAAPPDDEYSPWPELRAAVSFASGSTRISR